MHIREIERVLVNSGYKALTAKDAKGRQYVTGKMYETPSMPLPPVVCVCAMCGYIPTAATSTERMGHSSLIRTHLNTHHIGDNGFQRRL